MVNLNYRLLDGGACEIRNDEKVIGVGFLFFYGSKEFLNVGECFDRPTCLIFKQDRIGGILKAHECSKNWR